MKYRNVLIVVGPLVTLDKVKRLKYQEMVNICLGYGTTQHGQVLGMDKLWRCDLLHWYSNCLLFST